MGQHQSARWRMRQQFVGVGVDFGMVPGGERQAGKLGTAR